MSSSLSPEQSATSGSSPADPSRLGSLFRNLTEKRTTRDGNTPKRRGPKPDAKPALTRRQELNRQAQRTHRERKEQYVKALEEEVLRMKEIYSGVSRDKDALLEENRQLKDVLMLHGIPFLSTTGHIVAGTPQTGSEGYATASQGNLSPSPQRSPGPGLIQNQQLTSAPSDNGGVVDPEQAGIDFVLTLERPCMSHMFYVVDTLNATEGPACGHALMASCPPPKAPDALFGSKWTEGRENQQTWELSKGELTTLLNLSSQLDLGGEITPVMAWKMILSDPRVAQFKKADFEELMARLAGRIKCYGFGAVLEEWELRDAIDGVTGQQQSDAMVF